MYVERRKECWFTGQVWDVQRKHGCILWWNLLKVAWVAVSSKPKSLRWQLHLKHLLWWHYSDCRPAGFTAEEQRTRWWSVFMFNLMGFGIPMETPLGISMKLFPERLTGQRPILSVGKTIYPMSSDPRGNKKEKAAKPQHPPLSAPCLQLPPASATMPSLLPSLLKLSQLNLCSCMFPLVQYLTTMGN